MGVGEVGGDGGEPRKGRTLTGHDFTPGLRRTLAGAREEVQRLHHGFVGTEHMLLALTRAHDGDAAPLLIACGLDIGELRSRVEARAAHTRADHVSSGSHAGELPYTSRAKKVVELAMGHARQLNSGYVGAEHLLLGLLEDDDGTAGRVLRELGLRLEDARRVARGGTSRGASAGFRILIDDTSDRSIHDQIAGRVQEGVATGQLRPGDRLPTVRQLADDLGVAPGTVARAYAELERRGVVVTEGARGTRVARGDRAAVPAGDRAEVLVGLLRPVAVAAFHLGATGPELRDALATAMRGIFKSAE